MTSTELLKRYMEERHALGFVAKTDEGRIRRFLQNYVDPPDGTIEFTKEYVLQNIGNHLNQQTNTVLRDVSHYYENVIGYHIPPNTPFVGAAFNTTQAGIHADGLLKDEEIYNIFDTTKILKSPPRVGISRNSGAAGIAVWLSSKLGREVSKHDEAVEYLRSWVDAQYESGRVTNIGDSELEREYEKYLEASKA